VKPDLAHFIQADAAVVAIKKVEDCPHDRTPLLSHGQSVGRICFRVSLPKGENGFVGASNCFVWPGPRNSNFTSAAPEPIHSPRQEKSAADIGPYLMVAIGTFGW
jgi:hypothetical protein